ncbi:MAG: CsbD family protein [Bdellovibrionia bacterium]
MSGFTDKLKGKFDETVGKAKEKMADMSEHRSEDKNAENMKTEGQTQNLKGKGEGLMGDVKDKTEDVTEDIKDKFKKTG